MKLTRYRSHKCFMGKYVLVLQVGTKMKTGDHDDIQPSCRNVEYIEWRDAQTEDLITKESCDE